MSNCRFTSAGLGLTGLACAGLLAGACPLGLEAQTQKTEKHITDYVNFGESEPPQIIPDEKALQARPRKLGEIVPLKKTVIRPQALPPTRIGNSQTKLLLGRVDLYSSAFHGAGIQLDSLQTPATVTAIRGGSPAAYAGLQKGDLVRAYNLENQALALRFERNGIAYAVKLQTAKAQLETAPNTAPKTDPQTAPRTAVSRPLMGSAEKKAIWQQLSQYQIALLLDRSASMEESIAEGNESRWLWAQRIIEAFARDSQIQAQKSLILGTFASSHQINYQVNPREIAGLFQAVRPGGGTLACPPISEIVNRHFKSSPQTKLLLVIITDGTPDDFDQLSLLLKNMSASPLLAKQLTILFLGVGEDQQGKVVLEYFADGILQDGARADLVELIPFAQVRAGNLDWALAQALRRHPN